MTAQRLCDKDIEESQKLLQNIRGFLVLLPLFFLRDEDLKPERLTGEGMMPDELWT